MPRYVVALSETVRKFLYVDVCASDEVEAIALASQKLRELYDKGECPPEGIYSRELDGDDEVTLLGAEG